MSDNLQKLKEMRTSDLGFTPVSKTRIKTPKRLSELFVQYIDECRYVRNLRPETLKGYKEAFKVFSALMPTIETPNKITREGMSEFFHRLHVRKRIVGKKQEKVGVKLSTIRTYWSKLNSFFVWLEQNNYCTENPLPKIKPPEPIYDDKRALNKIEISRIISTILLHSYSTFLKKRDLAIVAILLFCGLRKNELVNLEIRDIDMDKRIMTIRGETSKSKKTRQIPIHPALHITLEEYFEERKKRKLQTPFVIASSTSDRGMSGHGLRAWAATASRLSGVQFHLHRFRHAFACTLAHQNTSSAKIQKLMGHTDLRMTERYLRSLTVEDLREDVDKLNIDNLR